MGGTRSDDSREKEWESLAEKVASGSESALRELYDEFGGFVYSIAFKMLGDSQEAEDATQDVFVKAWRIIDKFDSRKSTLKGWICVITRSTCLDLLRKRKVRPDRDKSHVVEFDAGKVGGDPATDKNRLAKESLEESLGLLRDDYRRMLELSYFKGYTQREIAEMVGVPEGTVKTFIRRGLLKLREVFEGA